MNDVRITFADNGYVVSYDDPEVRVKNHEDGPWVDPSRTSVFNDDKELMAALPTILEMVKKYEMSGKGKADSFNEAFTESTGS